MKTKLIRIGNSQGVRIPKPLIKESGLSGEIEMILRDNEIILRSPEETRKDWDQSFEKMAEKGILEVETQLRDSWAVIVGTI